MPNFGENSSKVGPTGPPWIPSLNIGQFLSRGLALLWCNEVPISLRHFSHNNIDMEVGHLGSDELWRFTGIYGFVANNSRVRLWDLLWTLAVQTSLPWLVAGDFNEILTNLEKFRGLSRGVAPMARFHRALVDCDLLHMGYVGSKFTWSNRHTKKRLDCSCFTSSWKAMYQWSRTLTLPPSTSDHNPLLIENLDTLVLHHRRPRSTSRFFCGDNEGLGSNLN